jgi:hypothetical protein
LIFSLLNPHPPQPRSPPLASSPTAHRVRATARSTHENSLNSTTPFAVASRRRRRACGRESFGLQKRALKWRNEHRGSHASSRRSTGGTYDVDAWGHKKKKENIFSHPPDDARRDDRRRDGGGERREIDRKLKIKKNGESDDE